MLPQTCVFFFLPQDLLLWSFKVSDHDNLTPYFQLRKTIIITKAKIKNLRQPQVM